MSTQEKLDQVPCASPKDKKSSIMSKKGGHSIAPKPQAPTPQAPVRNRQTRKVVNAQVRKG